MNQNTFRKRLYAVFSVIALIILVDYSLPGKTHSQEISDILQDRERYYNAAQNSHFSYRVITPEHEFTAKEDVVALEPGIDSIQYATSPLFNEVNWYQAKTSNSKSYHSLRMVSGLILPLLTLIVIFITLRSNKNIDTLLFVFGVVLIADLVFLII